MHVQLFRTVLIFLGLSLGSGLLAQQQQVFPTYRELKEEQRIILNAYLVRGENPYLLQAKAQFADSANSAKQNTFTAILLLSRARFRLDQHPTKIEQGRNAMGFRLSESDRKELREGVSRDIDPRFFSLQKGLEDLAQKFAAKGDHSVLKALRQAEVGNVTGTEQAIVDGGGVVKPDDSGLTPIPTVTPQPNPNPNPNPNVGPAPSPWQKPNQVAPGVYEIGNPPYRFQGPVVYTDNPPSIKVSSPPYPAPFKIRLDTELVNAAGVHFYQTEDPLGVWVIPPGKWVKGARLAPPDRLIMEDGTEVKLNDVKVSGDTVTINTPNGPVNVGPGGETPRRPVGPPPVAFKPVGQDGQEISDSDLADGVSRKYIGEKGGLLTAEQRLSLERNADGSPKGVTFGERRLWKFRLNPGESKSAGGGIQQTISLVEDGGSTAFSVSGWEAVSAEGRRATVEQSRTNPNEAVITFPGNGEYTITASGQTSGWEKSSPFKVRGKIPVFQ